MICIHIHDIVHVQILMGRDRTVDIGSFELHVVSYM